VTRELVGRSRELGRLEEFVRQSAWTSGALVLEGAPGVGKTSLWRSALNVADETHTILQARPAEAEAKLAYGGLSDLLEEVAPAVLQVLPAPQRAGLEGALLLRAPEAPLDPRLLGAALLAALRSLVKQSPLLIAIDDLQWLDSSSAATVAFAARRLHDDDRIAFLYTRRADVELPLVPAPPAGVDRLTVDPLGFDSTAELLAREFPGRISRPTARRIWNASEGNPLYALELAAAIDRVGDPVDPAQPLPVPTDLGELLSQRVARLPAAAHDVLLAAALLSEPTRTLVTRDNGEATAALDAAIAARVLEDDRGRLRFLHPLFASAVASFADTTKRREAHRSLATVVGDPERAALHLALATEGTDARIAALLDEATASALARGAPSAAADYAEHALRLTDPSDAHVLAARTAEAGRLRVLAGDQPRGVALLEEAVALLDAGPERANVLCLVAEGASHDPNRATRALAQALNEGAGDPAVKARALGLQSIMAILTASGLDHAQRDAAEAVAIAEQLGDPALIVQCIVNNAWMDLMRGESPEALVAHANSYPELLEQWPLFWLPERAQLFWQLRRGENDLARGRLRELKSRALSVGQEEGASVYAFHLSDLETAAGRWDAAALEVAELSAFAEWAPQAQPVALSARALLAACRGELVVARELALQGIALARNFGLALFEMENQAVLTLVATTLRDAGGVVAVAEPAWKRATENGLLNPGMLRLLPDYIEALIMLERLDEAEEPLGWLEQRSTEQRHPWGSMVAARCRGLEASARGELERADAAFAAALEPRDGVTLPFEEARTLLAQGEALRRAKRRRAARESLTAALEGFTRLGASAFADRARDELDRIGGRRSTTAGDLTPAQTRVAELVARGASNKEIAASLYLSEHTVESHLRQIYGKLGITSRVQLTLRLLG
jgi:DNA-binding CsgD family transcriptional regulator